MLAQIQTYGFVDSQSNSHKAVATYKLDWLSPLRPNFSNEVKYNSEQVADLL